MKVSEYAAREGITKQAALARIPHLRPKPKYKHVPTKGGRYVPRIEIDPKAKHTPGKPGPKKRRKP